MADGVRITVEILLPALVFAQLGFFPIGLAVSTGALLTSIVDTPGPVAHKRNAMLVCTLAVTLVSLVTGFARENVFALGAEIALACFFFSMLNVYGNRAGALGTAALLAMILVMDRPMTLNERLIESSLVFAGGLWYTALSLLFSVIQPYRPAQRALGECLRQTAAFLRIKADFYKPDTDLDALYRKLLAQQAVVSDRQDAVRELLFKTRQIVNDSTGTGRLLVLSFTELVDIYEAIQAIHYDYAKLRERFRDTGVLDHVAGIIARYADDLDALALSVQSNADAPPSPDVSDELAQLKDRIESLQASETERDALEKIIANLFQLHERLTDLTDYFNDRVAAPPPQSRHYYARFAPQQDYDPRILLDNLTMQSNVFRFALRMALACLFGFGFSKAFPHGQHGYWILLTIVIILKPAFSLTRQRNYERILGTVIGGAVGVLFLRYVQNETAEFVFLVVCMLGAYTMTRINYIAMVIFMTPYVLILFHFLGLGYMDVAEERLLDTVIGCVTAIAAGYLLFPTWESEQLTAYMREMLRVNINYLQKLRDGRSGKPVPTSDYKLARRDVYLRTANLSAAAQRMLAEPKRKQRNAQALHRFLVFNHLLSSNVASLATTEADNGHAVDEMDYALEALRESLNVLDAKPRDGTNGAARTDLQHASLIEKVSNDIRRTTYEIVGANGESKSKR